MSDNRPHSALRAEVSALCAGFPDDYWRGSTRRGPTRRSSSTP